MRTTTLVAVYMAIAGTYGLLYAGHSGRAAWNQASDLEEQVTAIAAEITNLQADLDDLNSSTAELIDHEH